MGDRRDVAEISVKDVGRTVAASEGGGMAMGSQSWKSTGAGAGVGTGFEWEIEGASPPMHGILRPVTHFLLLIFLPLAFLRSRQSQRAIDRERERAIMATKGGEGEPVLGVPYGYVASVPQQEGLPHGYAATVAQMQQAQAFYVGQNPYQAGMIPPNAIYGDPKGIPLQQTMFRDTPAPFQCVYCGGRVPRRRLKERLRSWRWGMAAERLSGREPARTLEERSRKA